MKKKTIRKKPARSSTKSRKSTKYNSGFLPYLVSGLVTLIVLFLFINYYNATRNSNVLGISSGTLLAKGGDDSGSSSGGDDHGGGSGGGSSSGSGNTGSSGSSSSGSSSGSDSSESGSSGSSGSGGGHDGFTNTSVGIQPSTVGSSAVVDCVGPDGKTFRTSFHDCQELNSKWGKKSFEFKEVSRIASNNQPRNIKVEPTTDIKIKLPPREEIENNDENENEDEPQIEQATDSSHFILRHKHVEVEVEDKLEHDPSATDSNSLLLTTPSGQQHILILPDQAVKNVLEKNKLTSILGDDASSSANLTKIKLLVKNDKAVFEIKGIKKEKLFGLFPVDIHKTADVSAETGDITGTSESFFSRVLDTFSF